ncbi:MAG: hypothetical protein ACOCWO_01895 [Candidatus Muiribacteriaceae bacterium]
MRCFVFIAAVLLCIFLVGCSSTSDGVADPTPEDTVIYRYSGRVFNADLEGVSGSEFSWTDSATYSFITDYRGDFTFDITSSLSDYYTGYYNTGGKHFSVFMDPAVTMFEGPDVVFTPEGHSFLLDTGLSDKEKEDILDILSYMSASPAEYSLAVSEAQSFIDSGYSGLYQQYLYILRDIADFSQDFSDIENMDLSIYDLDDYFDSDYLPPVQYYAGFLYSVKNLLGPDPGNFENVRKYLLKIRADELTFNESGFRIFNMSSDDIKALLLLCYILQGDDKEVQYYRYFSPDTDSVLGVHIKKMLDDMGFLREI